MSASTRWSLSRCPASGRKGARRLFEDGKIRVNGKRPNKGDLARRATKSSIGIADNAGPRGPPEPDAALVVRLENRALGGRREARRSTYCAASSRRNRHAGQRLGRPLPRDGGHRLLGARARPLASSRHRHLGSVLARARTREAFDALSARAERGRAREKSISCLRWPQGSRRRAKWPFRSPIIPKTRSACIPASIRATLPATRLARRTRASACSQSGEWALVEASASAAIRHQIRVHMAAIEHPLAGDALYDGPAVDGLDATRCTPATSAGRATPSLRLRGALGAVGRSRRRFPDVCRVR